MKHMLFFKIRISFKKRERLFSSSPLHCMHLGCYQTTCLNPQWLIRIRKKNPYQHQPVVAAMVGFSYATAPSVRNSIFFGLCKLGVPACDANKFPTSKLAGRWYYKITQNLRFLLQACFFDQPNTSSGTYSSLRGFYIYTHLFAMHGIIAYRWSLNFFIHIMLRLQGTEVSHGDCRKIWPDFADPSVLYPHSRCHEMKKNNGWKYLKRCKSISANGC